MKITKLIHSCLLVGMPEPVKRTALFDPGIMSESAVNVESLEFLDDIIITHAHGDHLSTALIKQLVAKFPEVRITAPAEVVTQLGKEGITAKNEESLGIVFFGSPHEDVSPLFPQPEQIGVNYLNLLTFPGDSHSFKQSLPILALPVTAPWGSTIAAANLALKLKPKYVLPIHDWHYSDQARTAMYDLLQEKLSESGISFMKLETGEPVVIDDKPLVAA